MKCTRCRGEGARSQLRAHNAAFCRACFLFYFRRQVERAIASRAHVRARRSASWSRSRAARTASRCGTCWSSSAIDTTGLYLALGIGELLGRARSETGRGVRRARATCRCRVVDSADEGRARRSRRRRADAPAGRARRAARSSGTTSTQPRIDRRLRRRSRPATTSTTRRRACSATCCAGRWTTWRASARSCEPTHPKFVRKVKPLYLLSEYETAVYAFMRGIDYVVEECPNAVGATQLVYKDVLNRLEAASPGTQAGLRPRVPAPRRSRPSPARAAADGRRDVRALRHARRAASVCALLPARRRGRDEARRRARRAARRDRAAVERAGDRRRASAALLRDREPSSCSSTARSGATSARCGAAGACQRARRAHRRPTS